MSVIDRTCGHTGCRALVRLGEIDGQIWELCAFCLRRLVSHDQSPAAPCAVVDGPPSSGRMRVVLDHRAMMLEFVDPLASRIGHAGNRRFRQVARDRRATWNFTAPFGRKRVLA